MVKIEFNRSMPDGELAFLVHEVVMALNAIAEEAHRRELIIRYDIKPQSPGNPRLKAQVLTEVA